jgi:glycosyltransferase involved in cell wall biosynthesis
MITTFYPPYGFGGDATFVAELAEGLAARGHHVEVIHSLDSYRALAAEQPPAAPAPSRVVTHALTSRLGSAALLAAHQFGAPIGRTRALDRRIEAGRFDVVHFHNISLFGPAVLRLGRGVTFYTLHEHWLICEAHTLFRMNRALCDKPTCIRCALAYGRPPQWWRRTGLIRASLAHVDRVIAPSQAILDAHRAAGVDAPFALLPHFVAPPDRSAGTIPDLPDEPFILFAGRLERLKGAATLLPLVRRHPDLRLVIAGEGSRRTHLERLAAGCDRIQFVGRLTPAELRGVYARAAVVVVPSLTYEAFGLVAAEAMASGTPVIVRALGALAELARQAGALTFTTDDELLGHLRRLFADPEERRRLGTAGRRAYEQRWTLDRHIDEYLALVDAVRAEHAAARGVTA